MILKASQRGNARELANHLTNTHDNEHITLHRIDGFMGETIHDAFAEIEAISRGTKCTQPLFSVSLNPPMGQSASIADFEDAVARIAEKNNLTGQPHVIIFHEKEGRRHAHAVFSRIDAETMTAINLPFYKNRLMEISKALYLEHGWDLPDGHKNKEHRNPLNFTLAQWQQAKRLNEDPKQIKQILMECWQTSNNKATFVQALDEQGFTLAQGNRRGYVVVDWRGEVFSLSRWATVKTKALKEKLGDPADLPTVKKTQVNLDQTLKSRVQSYMQELRKQYQRRFMPLIQRKNQMAERHDYERENLIKKQKQREALEIKARQERFNKGMRALWDRITGKHHSIQKQNEQDAYESLKRDQAEKDKLIFRQLEQRQFLQERLNVLKSEQQEDAQHLKQAIVQNLSDEKIQTLTEGFEMESLKHENDFKLEM